MLCWQKTQQFREKDGVICYGKSGISEAKKAPFKVAFETEAFLASEMHIHFESMGSLRFTAPGAEQFFADHTVFREAQLLTGADGFAAARLRR